MRTEISFELICSECGTVLEAADFRDQVSDANSNINGICKMTNAYMAKMRMKIKPCPVCIEKARRPAVIIKEGLDLLSSVIDK